jgi:hypothetical protein
VQSTGDKSVSSEAAERAYEMKCLALAGLPRILAEPDADLFAVLCGGIEQECVDVARVGPRADHIQQPVTAVFVATELDADGPVGVVELGLLGGREIPITRDVEVGRDLVNDGRAGCRYGRLKSGCRPWLSRARWQDGLSLAVHTDAPIGA